MLGRKKMMKKKVDSSSLSHLNHYIKEILHQTIQNHPGFWLHAPPPTYWFTQPPGLPFFGSSLKSLGLNREPLGGDRL
jgi:hypothetical protein